NGKEVRKRIQIEDSERGSPLPEIRDASLSKASAAPATVSGAGVSTSSPSLAFRVRLGTLPLGARAPGKAIRTDPTSPETGLDRWWKCRGARWETGALRLSHFLSQREFGLRGRVPGEETLKRSIIAALVVAAAPFALAQS